VLLTFFKAHLKYGTDETLLVVDELFEHIQFYLMKASMELAKSLDLVSISIELNI
jgi:ribonucleotide reductase alpha subunit